MSLEALAASAGARAAAWALLHFLWRGLARAPVGERAAPRARHGRCFATQAPNACMKPVANSFVEALFSWPCSSKSVPALLM